MGVSYGLILDSRLVSILIDLGVYKSKAEKWRGQTASATEDKKNPAGLLNLRCSIKKKQNLSKMKLGTTY